MNFAFIGVPIFILPHVAPLSMTLLSDRYWIAASEAVGEQLSAAATTLGTLGVATPQTIGFLFLAVASALVSVVIFRSQAFLQVNRYPGIISHCQYLGKPGCLFIQPLKWLKFLCHLMAFSG
jgi:hypothetical protein